MSLIKKSIVLYSDNGTTGSVTIVKIGRDIGIKVNYTKFDKKSYYAGVKIAGTNLCRFPIESVITEYHIEGDCTLQEPIGIIIIDKDGEIVSVGGMKDIVSISELKEKTSIDNENMNEKSAKSGESSNKVDFKNEIPNDKEKIKIEKPEKEKSENKIDNFYYQIKDRLDEILTIYPRESKLEAKIPDSKWVKVGYSGDDYYVVGKLYDDGKISFIGYGVPGVKNVRPPKEADKYCDFLEINKDTMQGYWLMFQSADSGRLEE